MPAAFPALYRKRFIPLETVHLKNDTILDLQDNYIITCWNTLKPRCDISCGISGYFLNQGIKVSKILDQQGNLVYWYCDIIRTVRIPAENSIYFEDLLIDVIEYPNGKLKVADTGELADAYQAGLIDSEMLCLALHTTDRLLSMFEDGSFEQLRQLVEQYSDLALTKRID